MNETHRIVWATAFAKVYLEKRDYELAVLKASDAVSALEMVSANSHVLKPGHQRYLLEQFTKR